MQKVTAKKTYVIELLILVLFIALLMTKDVYFRTLLFRQEASGNPCMQI